MPELPEVETIKRQLAGAVTGRVILRARVLDPRAVSPASAASFQRRIRGQRIAEVSRRGKYLRFELKSGLTLMIHLRMTGRLIYTRDPFGSLERRHLRLFFFLDSGGGVAFYDQRRFGKAAVLDPNEALALWDRLGPEPLGRSFDAKLLGDILDGRRRPIKSLLLDQELIAGIGNIYADESLFRARIHPLRQANRISAGETARLTAAIKETLRDAIAMEGSSIDTYRTPRGRRGGFQNVLRVHRRAGEPCPGCGGLVIKIKVAGRGTYLCPSCQK